MECFSPVRQLGAEEAGGRWPSVWERIIEQNSNKIFDTIDVRKSLQIITDIIVTGPEMSCLSTSLTLKYCWTPSNNQRKD